MPSLLRDGFFLTGFTLVTIDGFLLQVTIKSSMKMLRVL